MGPVSFSLWGSFFCVAVGTYRNGLHSSVLGLDYAFDCLRAASDPDCPGLPYKQICGILFAGHKYMGLPLQTQVH
jgi:hypothetical protein